MKPFRFFYNACIHFYALAMLPKVFFSFKKYRGTFFSRLGFYFPKIEKEGKRLVWIHAVSLGETKAIALLIKKLKERDPSFKIVLSTITATGHEEGKRSAPGADWHVYLPFDFSYIIRPILKKVAPDFVILTETDFWYHFQDAAKNGGAKLIVVNGKISERSFNRYKKAPFFVRHLLKPIDHFFLQGELYRQRFQELSLPESKLIVTGNIKLDGMEINPSSVSDLILTLGSTHAPEEKIWISSLKMIWKRFPSLKVMIVPRHPERFEEVAKLLEEQNISFERFSKGGTLDPCPVLLIDSMGVLRECYAKSTLAFVGGSFTPKVGGHNILEPCFFGKPVLFGPHMHSQPDFLDLVRSYEAGIQISEKNLVSTVERLLASPEERSFLGENGLKLARSSKGALEITLNHLIKIMSS